MEQVKIKQKKKKVKQKCHENVDGEIEPNKESEINIDNVAVSSKVELEPDTTNESELKYSMKADPHTAIDTAVVSNLNRRERTETSNSTDCSTEIAQEVIILTDDEIVEVTIKDNSQSIKSTISDVAMREKERVKPSVPNYRELSALVNELQRVDISIQNKVTTSVKCQEVKPFSFEELESIFGIKEMVRSREFAVEFERHELQSPSHTHPLFDALTEYQRARSKCLANHKNVDTLMCDYRANQNCVWMVKECTKTSGSKCQDGFYYSKSYNYTDATFQDSVFAELQNDLSGLRSKAAEIHSLYSHSEHYLKIQVDELIWTSIVSGTLKMKESLHILFWVLRTSGWGYDKHLRKQLRNWCCLLANSLLERDNSLINTLFVLHHILRISQGIRWALHLIQCDVKSVSDIESALCLLETILIFSRSNTEVDKTKIAKTSSSQAQDDDEAIIACEADESLWIVVDSDGEGADLETVGSKTFGALKENDIVGLIKQIPFKKIFQELMLIRNNGNEEIFCGSNLSGGSILKVFSATRLILKIIRIGLVSYKNYLELSKELCRIALHCVMYCTDLWESASSKCEANLVERLSIEYNNVFLAGWSTIKCTGSKDICYMFLSELPFKLSLNQNITVLCKSLTDNLVVSDSVQCYYTLVTISNMAIARIEEDFIVTVVKNLFEIGYLSDFSDLSCGEWARTLCGTVLHTNPQYIGVALNMMPSKVSTQWFHNLPLNLWRPTSQHLLNILQFWKEAKIDLIPLLLKVLDWKCHGGLGFDNQRDVAIFLCNLAQQLTQPKKPPPEWIWECVLILKLHYIEWELDISKAPSPESLPGGLDISGKCQLTNFALMLMTSWGHSIPLIFQHATPLLIKLANSGRFTEVIHVVYYIMPILSEYPDTIGQCKLFKELLSIIIQAEKSYTKMATRFVTQDFPGPIVKMFADMIRFQLHYFSKFRMTSINFLVSVWINWLTFQDNWQSDWIVVYLLDVILGSSFLNYNCMVEAANIFRRFIQTPSCTKSPTSSSFSSWLWNSSSSFKGLIQCDIEAPFVWHVVLWIEHTIVERDTGLWQRLIERLNLHTEGTKVNIDKTLKAVGCSDTSSVLVLYRSLQCAINTPISHPIVSLLWQLFFYLYLDVSFLTNQVTQPQPKPLGPLFFQGIVNSRILAKAKSRLLETKIYHDTKVKEISDSEEIQSKMTLERVTYHKQQSQLMDTFHTWLEENFFQDMNNPKMYTHPYYSKMCSLMSGYSTTWTETIDLFELDKFQNSSYLLTSCGDIERFSVDDSSEPFAKDKCHSSNFQLPAERILQRINTYEDPATTLPEYLEATKLASIVDPFIYKDSNAVFQLIKIHLEELHKLSRKYINMCHKLNSIDGNFYQILPTLYEKKRFLKTYTMTCGATCLKSAQICLQGFESILKDAVNQSIVMNRTLHETIVAEIMEPYQNLAMSTAIISKLAQLTCNDSILNNEGGVAFFNIIMNALSEDVLKCPPVKQILNTVATLLGEKFISSSGRQCILLINHYKDMENMGLICSLLRPLELSSNEMLAVYGTISSCISNIHIAFSCLSKFHISTWLKDVRPPVSDRSKLLMHICHALGAAGCTLSVDRLVLQELLCIHLSQVLSWEFPIHLNQVLSSFCELTIDKKLPPDCWEHCINVVETYPSRVSHRQACNIMESFGQKWWSRRNNGGSISLYGAYEMYIPCIGRLGALLTSTILNSAMLHQPLLLTHQISSVVFNAMCAFWNVWLIPWCGGTQSVWQAESTRSQIILPWNVNDVAGPEIVIDGFVETVAHCVVDLPGSSYDFLRLTWQWYVNNYPHVSVSPHILNKVHKSLLKLPWSTDANHWITFSELQTVSKICNVNLPSCHTFALQCLGDIKWQLWFNSLPQPLQPNALQFLFPIFFKLRPEKHILSDAASLPWNLLKLEYFEEILNWYLIVYNNPMKPFYADETFPLLCAMAGLKVRCDCNQDWQTRRVGFIKAWVNGIASYSQAIVDAKQKIKVNESIASSVTDLLSKLESSIINPNGASENQQLAECSQLLNTAIMMLNITTLQDITINKWLHWVSGASNMSIMALLSCILNITQRSVYANLAEHTLSTFFKNRGKWNFVKDTWKNNCIIPVDYLIVNDSLLTAFATYVALDRTKYLEKIFDQVDKRIIQTFHGFEPTCNSEKEVSLWICYMVALLRDPSLSGDNCKFAANGIKAILEKWSQEPPFEIFKAIRLVQNISPTYRFRIVARYSYCAVSDLCDNIIGSNLGIYTKDSNFIKIASALEAMAEQKQCADVKHVILKYAEYSKDRKNCRQHILKRVTDLCSGLYSDANYLVNTFELLHV
ncbi:ectopic P-granules autophagy protein 5 [Arctopsyche grandis]|uniref:ectopic P-granules autophagy protein 5 n=1 Tax=Arctopsyche grandis TaxID=121162 RepID=UPI00406D856E